MFNPEGDDRLGDEYVCIYNREGEPVDMAGWTLSDAAGEEYHFSAFELGPRAHVRVHTASGTDTASDLFWGKAAAVWTNSGDTAKLVDAHGDEVYVKSFGPRPDGDATDECGALGSPTPTHTPTRTPSPTHTSIPAPTITPTYRPMPTLTITPTSVPTPTPSPTPPIDCSRDLYNCPDFRTCPEVMEVFNACPGDPNKLDGNDDGIPCESLCR